jgi:hypothetical protein
LRDLRGLAAAPTGAGAESPGTPLALTGQPWRIAVTIDRLVLVFAATMILIGTVLAATVSPLFLLLIGFVGANLLQSAFTGFCPLARLLKRAGCPVGQLYR